MTIFKLINQGMVLLETALSSRYSDPKKYQQYVAESGRRELAQEVASVIRSTSGQSNSAKLKVLDVAAGTGLVSQALLQEGCLVMAFDHSAEMLDLLSQQFKGIKTQVGDMNQPWSFADASFDAVTIVWGNRYIVDPDHFAQEAFRVLKPGGVIVWPIFWLERPLWWLFLLKRKGIFQLFSIFNLTPNGTARIVQSSGFAKATHQSSRLGKKVSWWQKPVYVIAKKV